MPGYKLLDRPATGNLPPVYVTKTVPPSPGVAAAALTPQGTVRAYFAAINAKDYTRAWNLDTYVHNQTFGQFKHGLSGTVHDTLTVLSTTGNVVTAKLLAQQSDNTVKTFEGTYTVTNGVITFSKVAQTGTQ